MLLGRRQHRFTRNKLQANNQENAGNGQADYQPRPEARRMTRWAEQFGSAAMSWLPD